MPRYYSTGVEAPIASDTHPLEGMLSGMASSTNAAIASEIGSVKDLMQREYVSRATASQYGIPGPANSLTIGEVEAAATPGAWVTGTPPQQTLGLRLPYGPRGPQGPGGAFALEETTRPGIFKVAQTPTAAFTAAIQPYVWTRGRVTSGMDVRAAALGAWTVGSASEFDSLLNKPPAAFRGAGFFEVFQFASTFKAIRWTYTPTLGTPVQLVSAQFSSGWTTWEPLGWGKGEVPAGADVRTLPAGEWSVRSFATFDSLKNAPAEARGIGTITVLELTATARTITWTSAPSTGDPKVLYGYTLSNTFIGWIDFTPKATAPTPAPGPGVDTGNTAITTNPVNAGLRNSLLREAFYRRYRTRSAGKAVISIRFDDGHNAFKSDILPLMREFGFPYSIAACSRRWDHVENNAVTPAEMNSWVVNDKAEIWNHTATHRDGNGPTDEIVEGLRELRAQLPAAEIWGWYAPGIEGGYSGMLPTRDPHNLSGTLGGQLALANHAVVSGYAVGTARRPIEAMPSTDGGFGHYSMDGRVAADFSAEVDRVITEKARENFMMHPSRLDLSNGVSRADMRAFLVKLRTEVAAGRLLVLSPYQMEAVTT